MAFCFAELRHRMNTKTLSQLLDLSASSHSHLCPRQILGVRMGMHAGDLLNLPLPQHDKRLLVITETDGCFVDGLSAATNATVGHRTMRVEDYGKAAAVFVDTQTEQAIRIAPATNIRQLACGHVPEEQRHYFAQMKAYQTMQAEIMFNVQTVLLSVSLRAILSRPGIRVECEVCGEEIMNEREIIQNGLTLCRACAGPAYYRNPVSIPVYEQMTA